MARIDGILGVTAEEPVRQDRVYSSSQVISILDSAITGGGGGGGGTTTNRTHQMATYQTLTNPAKVYFTALEQDGVTPIVERTQTGVVLISSSYHLYGYDMPLANGQSDYIAVWDEGDPNLFTLAWEVIGSGTGIVTPPEDLGGTGIAQVSLTATQSSSSLLHLDASASVGDGFAWEIDGTPRPETTNTVTYGPLPVGVHNVKLTVTNASDASFAIHHQDHDVAWLATPLGTAQVDIANGVASVPTGLNLAPWTTADHINIIGPWITVMAYHMEDTGGGGDGDARITTYDDNHISFMNRVGDYDPNGYRPNMQITEGGYDGISAGYPLGTNDIDPTGNVATGDVSGELRFYRVEYMLPDTNPGGAHSPGAPGFGAPGEPWKYQFNFAESHAGFGGAGMWRFTPEIVVNATRQGLAFNELVNGAYGPVQMFDLNNWQYNSWYNYVVEYKQSIDPGIGYIRVWRDGAVVTNLPAGADGAGRLFAATAATDSGGNVSRLGFNIQNYKGGAHYTDQTTDYPDVIVHYRNVRIGPTMASVMQ